MALRRRRYALGEFKWGSRHYKPPHDRDRPRVDKLHSVTPPEFRDELIGLARSVARLPMF